MCLQAGWELGQLQEMDSFDTATTQAFPVDPRTMKMVLTVDFMSQKGWVDARLSLPGSMEMVTIVKWAIFQIRDDC